MMRNVISACAAILLLSFVPASGQTSEQVQIIMTAQNIPCDGSAGPLGNYGQQVAGIENFVDGILPSPIYINRAIIWWDGAGAIPSTSIGNVALAIDPGKTYISSAGYPSFQKYQVNTLKTLGIYEAFAGGRRQQVENFNPPIGYRAGTDALLISPECAGGGRISPVYFGISFTATADILSLPLPTQLLNVQLNTLDYGNAAQTSRSVIAGPVAAASKVRVHIAYPWPPTSVSGYPLSVVNHMSVCLQNGTSQNCLSAPIELKFAGQSGMTLYQGQWIWSDWTPISVPAGQNLLVIASMTQPGSVNAWNRINIGGLGAWSSFTDSWNSATMLGTVVAQPGWTQVVDRVQVQ